jgi:hypothetical protein
MPTENSDDWSKCATDTSPEQSDDRQAVVWNLVLSLIQPLFGLWRIASHFGSYAAVPEHKNVTPTC